MSGKRACERRKQELDHGESAAPLWVAAQHLRFFLRAMGSHWKLYGEKRQDLIYTFKSYSWDSPRGPVVKTL